MLALLTDVAHVLSLIIIKPHNKVTSETFFNIIILICYIQQISLLFPSDGYGLVSFQKDLLE